MEFFETAFFAYLNFWREPISLFLSHYSIEWNLVLADLSFIWISIFSSVNLMTLFFHGETVWGHYDGNNEPLQAFVKSAGFFTICPIVVLAGFVTSRWEAQDASVGFLLSWIVFLLVLAYVANCFL